MCIRAHIYTCMQIYTHVYVCVWINKGIVSRVLRDYFDIWEERGVEDDRKVFTEATWRMELLFTGTRKPKQRTSLKKAGVPITTR